MRDTPAGASAAEKKPAGDAPVRVGDRSQSILVATANRTTGAVICGLLRADAREARWVARKALESALAGDDDGAIDLVIAEVEDQSAINAIANAALQGPPIVAVAPIGKSGLRTACEKAGFAGCVVAPLDPPALLELVNTVLAQSAEAETDATGADDGKKGAVIDRRALDDLVGLGGNEFVDDIVGQFLADAVSLLQALHEAVADCDEARFRDQAHALRSCAANVGASSVYSICLNLRAIGADEIAAHGEAHMKKLEAEFSLAREALATYLNAR